ncbi:MAG: ATP-binding protein [bacterium]
MDELFEKIKKYNVWEGHTFHAGLERKAYLERISNYLGNRLVKVIVGQRRSGKSYLLRQIILLLIKENSVNPKNIFYLNKEYTAFSEISTAKELEELVAYYRKRLNVTGRIYIFLDEVQTISHWESLVNSYSQDFTTDYEVFVTGSNSTLLAGELASRLSGRYVEFELFPFSLFEYGEINERKIGKELFLTYIQTGGLPEMINFSDEEVERHYVNDLRNTIVLRDIMQRKQVKDPVLLEEIFDFLSTNIGNLTSLTSIVKYFKSKQKQTNYETLSTYVNNLLETFVIHQVERYDLRGKKTLGGVRKYYLNDLAFKNYLFGYYPSDIGYHLENYVFLQLKRLGFNVSVGILRDAEIDFVAQKQGKTKYIQVAYLLGDQKTAEREFGNLLSIRDNHEKIVISLDDIKFSDYKGIQHFWPWELV